jgi:tRNA A37 threonylcarbamoyladenosine synthetase subunit TsaC/SUA5/YrdC
MQTEILSPTPEHIAVAAAALLQGQLVAIPTETVYGLAGNGLDEQAVANIFYRPVWICFISSGLPYHTMSSCA